MKKEFRLSDNNIYYDFYEKLSDRELQEQQTFYLRNIDENSKSIKNYVQFFFWVTIISAIISIVIILPNL